MKERKYGKYVPISIREEKEEGEKISTDNLCSLINKRRAEKL